MGMDVAFNRQAAIAAGLVLVKERNGTEEQIAEAKNDPHEDPMYIAYLEREDEFIKVPGTEMLAHNGGVNDIVVRANKWGSIYEPLTNWLKANNITWWEF